MDPSGRDSKLQKAAGLSLTLLGAILIVLGGVAYASARGYAPWSEDSFKWIAGEVLFIFGLVLLPAGLKLMTGKDLAPSSDRSRIALGCYIAGGGILVASLFPISLAIRDPDFRWLCIATSLGGILIGIGFIIVGRKVAQGTSRLPWYSRSR